MEQETILESAQALKLYKPDPTQTQYLKRQDATSPNEWFGQRYHHAFKLFGSPFLELVQPIDQFTHQIQLLSINLDFFGSVLGGRKDFGHHTIYYEPEMQFYFYDLADLLYKSTTPEKLGNQYRALLMKCAEEMPANVHKLNLFHEFRSDKTTKAVVNRAKSILAADETFFSVNSSHQRKQGPELPERLGRVFVESWLEKRDGSLLTLTKAYQLFNQLSAKQNLAPIKKVVFMEMMRDRMKEQFGICLRNDVLDLNNKQQKGWKGVGVSLEVETVA